MRSGSPPPLIGVGTASDEREHDLMDTLTIPQTRSRLERTLNDIWRMGDREECSIKHTGYGLIALAFDRPWTDAVDYATPGGPFEAEKLYRGTVKYGPLGAGLARWAGVVAGQVWDGTEDDPEIARNRKRTEALTVKLDAAWATVAALREQAGHEVWTEAVLASESAWYFAALMPDAVDDYGIDADDPTLARADAYVTGRMRSVA